MALEMIDERRESIRSADDVDIASRTEARANTEAIECQRMKLRKMLDEDFDGKHCVECGEKIDPRRIEVMKYVIPVIENRLPHATDKICKNVLEIEKHGTDHCVHCEGEKAIKRKMFATH